MRAVSVLGGLLLLAACEQAPPRGDVVVCREGTACSVQPRDVVTHNPAEAQPDRDPDGRIAALEVLAEDKPSAAYDLALRLYRGDGFPRDSYRSLQWMRKAAEGGDKRAQLALGRFYMSGLEEMGPDLGEAETWLGLAASGGNAEAKRLHSDVVRAKANDDYYRRQASLWKQATYDAWYSRYNYYWGWNTGSRRWYSY